MVGPVENNNGNNTKSKYNDICDYEYIAFDNPRPSFAEFPNIDTTD